VWKHPLFSFVQTQLDVKNIVQPLDFALSDSQKGTPSQQYKLNPLIYDFVG